MVPRRTELLQPQNLLQDKIKRIIFASEFKLESNNHQQKKGKKNE